MTIKYTKEQLNKFDKDLLIELFLPEEPFWQIQRKNGGF